MEDNQTHLLRVRLLRHHNNTPSLHRPCHQARCIVAGYHSICQQQDYKKAYRLRSKKLYSKPCKSVEVNLLAGFQQVVSLLVETLREGYQREESQQEEYQPQQAACQLAHLREAFRLAHLRAGFQQEGYLREVSQQEDFQQGYPQAAMYQPQQDYPQEVYQQVHQRAVYLLVRLRAVFRLVDYPQEETQQAVFLLQQEEYQRQQAVFQHPQEEYQHLRAGFQQVESLRAE